MERFVFVYNPHEMTDVKQLYKEFMVGHSTIYSTNSTQTLEWNPSKFERRPSFVLINVGILHFYQLKIKFLWVLIL